MIELTTGVVFLLSSMYGAGSPMANATAVQSNAEPLIIRSAFTAETNKKELENYLKKNYSDTPILVEIAKCESTFVHYAKSGMVVRGMENKADVGIMQINEKYHLETAKKLGMDIYTVEGNVAYAKYLYEKSGTSPWSASQPCWQGKVVAMK